MITFLKLGTSLYNLDKINSVELDSSAHEYTSKGIEEIDCVTFYYQDNEEGLNFFGKAAEKLSQFFLGNSFGTSGVAMRVERSVEIIYISDENLTLDEYIKTLEKKDE